MADAGKKVMTIIAAVITACILVMGCSTPAYAKTDPGWGQEGNTGQGQDSQDPAIDNTGDSGNEQDRGSDPVNENEEGNGSSRTDEHTVEPGFTTPGNGSLGDRIKNSNGKDFFTVRTKNNNTFYLVIDHTNSTENVYMLSLIDENDLAEFLEAEEKKEEKTTAPVVIPQTKPQTETPESEKKDTPQQPVQAPFQNSFIWILCAAAAGLGALYYFKVYKPGREEEDDDNEGMESAGDGFEIENEG